MEEWERRQGVRVEQRHVADIIPRLQHTPDHLGRVGRKHDGVARPRVDSEQPRDLHLEAGLPRGPP